MEKRVAPDGVRYTEQEFLNWFGAEKGAWHWAHSPDAAAAVPAAVADGSVEARAHSRSRELTSRVTKVTKIDKMNKATVFRTACICYLP